MIIGGISLRNSLSLSTVRVISPLPSWYHTAQPATSCCGLSQQNYRNRCWLAQTLHIVCKPWTAEPQESTLTCADVTYRLQALNRRTTGIDVELRRRYISFASPEPQNHRNRRWLAQTLHIVCKPWTAEPQESTLTCADVTHRLQALNRRTTGIDVDLRRGYISFASPEPQNHRNRRWLAQTLHIVCKPWTAELHTNDASSPLF